MLTSKLKNINSQLIFEEETQPALSSDKNQKLPGKESQDLFNQETQLSTISEETVTMTANTIDETINSDDDNDGNKSPSFMDNDDMYEMATQAFVPPSDKFKMPSPLQTKMANLPNTKNSPARKEKNQVNTSKNEEIFEMETQAFSGCGTSKDILDMETQPYEAASKPKAPLDISDMDTQKANTDISCKPDQVSNNDVSEKTLETFESNELDIDDADTQVAIPKCVTSKTPNTSSQSVDDDDEFLNMATQPYKPKNDPISSKIKVNEQAPTQDIDTVFKVPNTTVIQKPKPFTQEQDTDEDFDNMATQPYQSKNDPISPNTKVNTAPALPSNADNVFKVPTTVMSKPTTVSQEDIDDDFDNLATQPYKPKGKTSHTTCYSFLHLPL